MKEDDLMKSSLCKRRGLGGKTSLCKTPWRRRAVSVYGRESLGSNNN